MDLEGKQIKASPAQGANHFPYGTNHFPYGTNLRAQAQNSNFTTDAITTNMQNLLHINLTEWNKEDENNTCTKLAELSNISEKSS